MFFVLESKPVSRFFTIWAVGDYWLVNLPWLGSFPGHSLPFSPLLACTSSLHLGVTIPLKEQKYEENVKIYYTPTPQTVKCDAQKASYT